MKQVLAIIAACFLVSMSSGATAGDRSAQSLPGWEAVGRLNISGKYMCTASLIAPNLVLTAAHCLFDARSGRRISPREIKFEAGLHGRRSKAARTAAKAVLHPLYVHKTRGAAQLGHDLAVLRLETPISAAQIQPFRMKAQASRGDAVDVLSYSYHHANRMNREQGCYVLQRQTRTLVMSCRVDFGASGAPVLEIEPGQAPRIVSVISSKAAMGQRRVSIGTTFDATIQNMMRSAS